MYNFDIPLLHRKLSENCRRQPLHFLRCLVISSFRKYHSLAKLFHLVASLTPTLVTKKCALITEVFILEKYEVGIWSGVLIDKILSLSLADTSWS